MRRIVLLAGVLLALAILSAWPFPGSMSCWVAASEGASKEHAARFAERNDQNFSELDLFLKRSDFRIRNIYRGDGAININYTTNYSNFDCWYLNIISFDGTIVRLRVDDSDRLNGKISKIN